jgi:hypothetical protein
MRTWLILLFAGLLAACQQPAGIASAPTRSSHLDTDPSYFQPEVDALLDQVAGELAGICVDRATSKERFDACIREEFAHAFDDSGVGHKSCAFHAALTDFLDCIAVGNAFIDVRHRLSDDSPVPAGYWSGRSAMADALASTVVSRGVKVCGETGGLKQLTACVETWFEKQLALPARLTERCNAKAAGEERQGCIGEAFMLRYLQDHAPRVGAIST